MYFKNLNKALVTCSIITCIYACSPALYKPTPEHVTEKATYEQLVAGRNSYVNKCGSCHSLYLPQQYDETVWKHNLDEMQERSNVSNKEKELILLYLNHYKNPG